MPAFELFNAVNIKAGGFLRPFYPFFYRFEQRIGVTRFVVGFSYYFCSFSVGSRRRARQLVNAIGVVCRRHGLLAGVDRAGCNACVDALALAPHGFARSESGAVWLVSFGRCGDRR